MGIETVNVVFAGCASGNSGRMDSASLEQSRFLRWSVDLPYAFLFYLSLNEPLVSLVDGYNLPIAITTNVNCEVAGCAVDLGPNCAYCTQEIHLDTADPYIMWYVTFRPF